MFVQRAAIGELSAATERTATTASALRDGMQAAALDQALRADVYLALQAPDSTPARQTVQDDGQSLLASLASARQRSTDPAVAAALSAEATEAQGTVEQTSKLLAATGAQQRVRQLALDASFGRLATSLRGLNDGLAAAASNAADEARWVVATNAKAAQLWLTLTAFAAFLWAARLVSRGITRPLEDCVTGLRLARGRRPHGAGDREGRRRGRGAGDLVQPDGRRPGRGRAPDPRGRVDAGVVLG